jgi:hypothetical protein
MTEQLNTTTYPIEVPSAAREFVKRNAVSAKDGAAKVHAGAERLNTAIQTALVASVAGSTEVTRQVMQNTYANFAALFTTVEKLANAKCLGEATQIHLDFIRDNGRANVEQVRETAATVRKAFTDTYAAARDGFSKTQAA